MHDPSFRRHRVFTLLCALATLAAPGCNDSPSTTDTGRIDTGGTSATPSDDPAALCSQAVEAGNGGHDCLFCAESRTFDEVGEVCAEWGGYPVMIEDEAENQFLYETVFRQEAEEDERYLRLDRRGSRDWEWYDSTPVGSFFPQNQPDVDDWDDPNRECVIMCCIRPTTRPPRASSEG